MNSESTSETESSINKIALAALSTLPVEQSFDYVRNLIKDETFESIQNREFVIEVCFIIKINRYSNIFY